MGMPGLTACVGLLDSGEMKAGDTVVVSAASGAVGSVVGQLARIKGAKKVVGVAGPEDKCRYVVDELGFDACVSHRSATLREDLKAACPDGVDVYFENVGGPTLEAALALMNPFGRIPVCGLISMYNTGPQGEGEDKLRSEEHTSELQSLIRISYAVLCLKKTKSTHRQHESK